MLVIVKDSIHRLHYFLSLVAYKLKYYERIELLQKNKYCRWLDRFRNCPPKLYRYYGEKWKLLGLWRIYSSSIKTANCAPSRSTVLQYSRESVVCFYRSRFSAGRNHDQLPFCVVYSFCIPFLLLDYYFYWEKNSSEMRGRL